MAENVIGDIAKTLIEALNQSWDVLITLVGRKIPGHDGAEALEQIIGMESSESDGRPSERKRRNSEINIPDKGIQVIFNDTDLPEHRAKGVTGGIIEYTPPQDHRPPTIPSGYKVDNEEDPF